jgi:hypothetical protein
MTVYGEGFNFGGFTDGVKPFVPEGSPILWLKADSLSLTDSDPVASWADQSGQGNNAVQNTEALRPVYIASDATLNNKPSVQFNRATGHFMLLTGMTNSASDYTFQFVLSPDQLGTSQVQSIFDTETGRLALEVGNGATGIRYFDTAYRGTVDCTTGGQVLTYVMESPASGRTYKNETLLESSLSYSAQRAIGGTVSLGAHYPGSSEYDGNIAEVLVYASVLSDADRNANIDGLKSKYGIT